MVMVIRGRRKMSRRAYEERRTFTSVTEKDAMFIARLRSAYTGFRFPAI